MSLFRNAREGLVALLERYRGLHSYADEGFVRALGAGAAKTCWFETIFKEPEQFRFEFARPHPYPPLRHIVTTSVIGANELGAYFASRHTRTGQSLEAVASLEVAVAMVAALVFIPLALVAIKRGAGAGT